MTIFVIKQVEDRKNPGKMIAAAFIGRKIGFCFDDLGDYTGLFMADKVIEKDNYFRFGGKKVKAVLPDINSFYDYCKRNHIVVNSDIKTSSRGVVIFTDDDYHKHFLTEIDGEIYPMEPFEYEWLDRRGCWHYSEDVYVNRGFMDAYNLMKYQNPDVKAETVYSIMVRKYDNYVASYRFYKKLGVLAVYRKPYFDERFASVHSFLQSLIQLSNDGIVCEYRTESDEVSGILDNDYDEYTGQQIADYMKENFIGNPRRSYNDHIGYNVIYCAGNDYKVYMFDQCAYDPAVIPEEDKAFVAKSKEDLIRYRKYLAKNLGAKSYVPIAKSLTDEAVLNI